MGTGDPRVTIGLPTYNGQRFLAEAIESLLGQDFGDFELLVADNASGDETPEICRRFAREDRRVRYLPADRNRGAAWNFNRLVDECRSGYFKWAADDDTYDPEFLGPCVDVLDRRPDIVLCFTQAVEIDDDGCVIEKRGPTNVADLDDPVERFRAVLFDEVYCYSVFGVVRTPVLLRTGLIGPFAQSDRVLLAELSLHGRFVELPEPSFRHREHQGRSMHAYTDDRTRLRWFDTSLDGSFSMPRWRLGVEYGKALRRASPSLSSDQARRASAILGPWGMRNGRVLARELAKTGVARASSPLRRQRPG